MQSNKMSEMNSLESRDSKQKCRGRIKGLFYLSDKNATVITVTPLTRVKFECKRTNDCSAC